IVGSRSDVGCCIPSPSNCLSSRKRTVLLITLGGVSRCIAIAKVSPARSVRYTSCWYVFATRDENSMSCNGAPCSKTLKRRSPCPLLSTRATILKLLQTYFAPLFSETHISEFLQ